MAIIQGEAAILDTKTIKITESRKQIKISLRAINFLLAFSFVVLFVGYVIYGSGQDVSSIKLGNAQTHYEEVIQSNTHLEARAAYLRSYDYLNVKINALGMVKAENIKTIIANNQVAKN
ncbi:MAG: hypothetical protein PHR00_02185 [Patescibacteria group bacterium]|nr:hypothetical protein [Patescibacteria group bacterium]